MWGRARRRRTLRFVFLGRRVFSCLAAEMRLTPRGTSLGQKGVFLLPHPDLRIPFIFFPAKLGEGSWKDFYAKQIALIWGLPDCPPPLPSAVAQPSAVLPTYSSRPSVPLALSCWLPAPQGEISGSRSWWLSSPATDTCGSYVTYVSLPLTPHLCEDPLSRPSRAQP